MTDFINREYKDRLFAFIFGREENKQWTLSLYNAINGTDYDNSDEIEINTIDNFLYMGMKNDVSFLLHGEMNIYEQQSSYNPNMPVRELMYIGRLYDKYISSHKLNIFGQKQVYLPVPKLVVFYNGGTEKEDTVLKLSDAFSKNAKPDISVNVKMVNINPGNNDTLLQKCRPLYEYSVFVDRIRAKCKGGKDLETAVDESINEMPKDSELYGFLINNRAEVKGMLFTEYNEEEIREFFKEDARREFQEQMDAKDKELDAQKQEIAELKEQLAALGGTKGQLHINSKKNLS